MDIEIKNLSVTVENKTILQDFSLHIKPGQIHALMGPNGSGKSTLSYVLAGHPGYEITQGDILVDGTSILELSPDERAKLGLFLSFQQPLEIPGITFSQFLYQLAKLKDPSIMLVDFQKQLNEHLALLGVDKSFVERDLNVGFSGGEKKRAEMLQLLTLKPKFAILDELDSGLDVDTMRVLSNALNALRGQDFSALIITHYQRILHHITPDVVHVLVNGKIVETGDQSLAQHIEERGYKEHHERAQSSQ